MMDERLVCGLVPRRSVVPILLLTVMNMTVFYGGKLLSSGKQAIGLETAIDRAVPFLPFTVVFYLLAFAFWAVNYVIAARREESVSSVFFAADFVMRLVCFIFFVFMPVTITRQDPAGSDVFSVIVRVVYAIDTPEALFPSLHCAQCAFAVTAVAGNKKVPAWYKVFSCFFAAAVCVSTLTVKQHFAADCAAGVALSLAALCLASVPAVTKAYKKMIGIITPRCLRGE